jgi:hypothetical protein
MKVNGNLLRGVIRARLHAKLVKENGFTPESPTEFTKIREFDKIKWPQNVKLLGSSQKVLKGEKKGYGTAVLYLSAASSSVPYGGRNMCPWASPECIRLCLGHTSGRLQFDTSQNAQLWKTLLFAHAPKIFACILYDEIKAHVEWCRGKGLRPCVRLNGDSDERFENLSLPESLHMYGASTIMEIFPNVIFYDYTKSFNRMLAFLKKEMPFNYHLTFSHSEDNGHEAERVLEMGGNVAVVFDTKDQSDFPDTFEGYTVVNGDETDLTFLYPAGSVVALTVKGKHVESPFFLPTDEIAIL